MACLGDTSLSEHSLLALHRQSALIVTADKIDKLDFLISNVASYIT